MSVNPECWDCRWSDGHERTWEPEGNLTKDLVAAFEADQAAKGIALRGSDSDDSAQVFFAPLHVKCFLVTCSCCSMKQRLGPARLGVPEAAPMLLLCVKLFANPILDLLLCLMRMSLACTHQPFAAAGLSGHGRSHSAQQERDLLLHVGAHVVIFSSSVRPPLHCMLLCQKAGQRST